MLITKIHQFLTATTDKKSLTKFWFALSMTFGLIYALLALKRAFISPYAVQDDARQHIFWMLRFIDPELFPNDLIADYFQSVAPAGYTAIYQLATTIGINPFLFGKILPLILGLICTYYIFNICLEMLPIPMTAFIAALVTNQAMWMKDDIASATPRAFVYPLFMAFLYYLLKRNLLGVGIAIALTGLFYPQYVFVASGILILRLVSWENGKFKLTSNQQDKIFCGVGLGVAFLVLLPYALTSSEYGPAISRQQAMELREFFPGGRSTFFHRHPKDFWLTGKRSGMFPKSLFTPATQCAALLFPFLLPFASVFPLIKQFKSGIWLLLQLLISSLGMFFIAHLLIFRLHLPSRYTGLSFRIIVALTTAIALTLIIDSLLRWVTQDSGKIKRAIALTLTSLIAASLILYPAFVKGFPLVRYKIGDAPALYQFLQQQPKDILIASLSEEANQIPTFARRSILAGREYAIPYQVGYYSQFRQRTLDLIRAQYTPNLTELKEFIQKYEIDFWLLHRGAFTPEYVSNNSWLMQFEPSQEAVNFLQQGYIPALGYLRESCTVFEEDNLTMLDSKCIIDKLNK
ncbi:MAG: hypothetical protein F6K35_15610 [Okeania sp. SIO2H7]|nr:hypothetical protein [Okeania sp. SIO2H7]